MDNIFKTPPVEPTKYFNKKPLLYILNKNEISSDNHCYLKNSDGLVFHKGLLREKSRYPRKFKKYVKKNRTKLTPKQRLMIALAVNHLNSMIFNRMIKQERLNDIKK